jgi:hypothetical protein
MSAMRILIRRDSAVKLVDDIADECPASANWPVGAVVISGDGKCDQAVESPEVNALVYQPWHRQWRTPETTDRSRPKPEVCGFMLAAGKPTVTVDFFRIVTG